LGFAVAGSIRFANADPNSYRYIHADTYADSHSYIDSNSNTYANTVPYSYGYTNKLYCS
jgi:hypothetical protein